MENSKLQMNHISKIFPGVKALSDVSLALEKGEVVSLVGENGAGKSTLIHVITGQFKPDEGELYMNGKPVTFHSPNDAIAHGIGLVPQELNLIPQLSVAENIYLGVKKLKKTFPYQIDWEDMYKSAEEILDILGMKLNVREQVGSMSVASQQLVQIARAVSQGAEILIFDEPTACLTLNETKRLMDLIRRFREEGKTIVFVSHHMEEVMELSDRVAIMRDGCLIEVLERDELNVKRMINGMVGREVERNVILRKTNSQSEIFLEVRNLSRKKEFENITFSVMSGEIFGIAGLVGAGRTELVSTIFGDRQAESGEIFLEGQKVVFKEPKQAIAAGIGYVPEERRNYGILPSMNIRENLTIAGISRLFRFPVIDRRQEKEIVDTYTEKVHVKMAGAEGLLTQLSGGNQQKVILARWLSMGCRFLILDEPTRGIDVLAKEEIHQLIRECADQGMTVLVVSSELEELIQLCSRVLIMHEGKQKGVVETKEVTSEHILQIALG